MMRQFCPHCGTTFLLEWKATGELGRVEGVRFVRATPGPRSWRQRLRWKVAAVLYDLATWASR